MRSGSVSRFTSWPFFLPPPSPPPPPPSPLLPHHRAHALPPSPPSSLFPASPQLRRHADEWMRTHAAALGPYAK